MFKFSKYIEEQTDIILESISSHDEQMQIFTACLDEINEQLNIKNASLIRTVITFFSPDNSLSTIENLRRKFKFVCDHEDLYYFINEVTAAVHNKNTTREDINILSDIIKFYKNASLDRIIKIDCSLEKIRRTVNEAISNYLSTTLYLAFAHTIISINYHNSAMANLDALIASHSPPHLILKAEEKVANAKAQLNKFGKNLEIVNFYMDIFEKEGQPLYQDSVNQFMDQFMSYKAEDVHLAQYQQVIMAAIPGVIRQSVESFVFLDMSLHAPSQQPPVKKI
jgi:hypothetical protein